MTQWQDGDGGDDVNWDLFMDWDELMGWPEEEPMDMEIDERPVSSPRQFVQLQGKSGERRVKRFGGSYDMDSRSWHDSGICQRRAQRKSAIHLASHEDDLSHPMSFLDDELDMTTPYSSDYGRVHGMVELPPNVNFIPVGTVEVVQGHRVRQYNDGRLTSDSPLYDDEHEPSRGWPSSSRNSTSGARQRNQDNAKSNSGNRDSRGNSRGGGSRRRGGSSVRQVTYVGSRGRQRSITIFG